MAQYRVDIDIVPKIQRGAFQEITQEANAALAQITAQLQRGAISPAEAGQAMRGVQIGAERQVYQARQAGEITPQFSTQARATLTKTFGDQNQAYQTLTAAIQQAAAAIGENVPLLTQAAARRYGEQTRNPTLLETQALAYSTTTGQRIVPPGQQAATATGVAAGITAQKQEESAQLRTELATNQQYIAATALAAEANMELGASVAQILAADGAYAVNRALLIAAMEEVRAATAGLLAIDTAYIQARALTLEGLAAQQAQVRAELAINGEYIASKASTAQSNREIAVAIREARQATTAYAATEVAYREAMAAGEIQELRLAASTGQLADLMAERARLRTGLRADVAERGAAGVGVPAGAATLAQEQARVAAAGTSLRAQVSTELSGNMQVATDRARIWAANLAQSASVSEAVNQAQGTLPNLMRKMVADTARRANVAAAAAGSDAIIANQVRERAGNAQRLTRIELQILANAQGELSAEAALRNAKRDRLFAEERLAINARLVGAAQQGVVPSRYQMWGAQLRERQFGRPVDPLQQQTLGQAFQSRLFTTAQFAVAGVGLRLLTGGLTNIIKQAEELQRAFAVIQVQFRSMGEEAQFPKFRAEMLSIARDSGITATEVAEVGRQMVGVYQNDVPRALLETRAAINTALVTGLPQKEIVDSLTAASRAYDTSIEDIGDTAVGVEQRYGVLARESIKFFGDIANAAEASGARGRAGLQELGAMAGVLQRDLGIAGSAIAENLGRVFANVDEQAPDILELFRRIPTLQGQLPNVEAAIGAGEGERVIVELATAWDEMSASQQRQVAISIGGARQYRTVIALLAGMNKELANGNVYIDDQGKVAQRAAAIQETFAQQVQRLREGFRQLGDALFQSGLGAFLTDLATTARGLIDVFGGIMRFLGFLNQMTGGLAGKLVALGLAFRGVALAMRMMQGTRIMEMLTRLGIGGVAGRAAQGMQGLAAGMGPGGAMPLPWGGMYAGGTFGAAAGMIPGVGRAAGAAGAGLRYGAGFMEGLGINPMAVGLVAAGAAYSTYEQQKQKAKSQADDLKGQIKRAILDGDRKTADLLRDRAEATRDIWSDVADIIGIDTPDVAADEAYQEAQGEIDKRRHEAEITILQQRGLIGDTVQRQILRKHGGTWGLGWAVGGLDHMETETQSVADFIASVKEQNGEAITDLDRIVAEAKARNPGLAAEIDAAANRAREGAQAAADQQGFLDKIGLSVQQVQQAYESGIREFASGVVGPNGTAGTTRGRGVTTSTEYLDVLNQQIDSINRSIASQGGESNVANKKLIDTRNQLEGQRQQLIANTYKQGVELYKTFQAYQRIDANVALDQQIAQVTAALGNVNLTDPEQRYQFAQNAMEIAHQKLLNMANHAGSQAERARILSEGIQLNDETINAIYEFLVSRGLITPTALDTAASAIAPFLGNQQGRLTGSDTEINDATEQVSQINLEIAKTRDPKKTADLHLQGAQAELAAVKANFTANKATQAEVNNAQAAVEEALKQQVDADRAIADARRRYNRGTAENALADAKLAQDEAKVALERASGEAARLDALAQQARADKMYQDAQAKIRESQLNLIRAQADSAGDVVRAAEQGVIAAREALDRALKDPNTGQEVINNLKTNLVQAQSSLAQQRVDQTKELIEFQLDVHEITVGQAIAQLQALLASPDVQSNQQRVRDIRRQIYQLQHQAAADMQFNIGDLQLPTYYEARRLGGMATLGMGFNDNRNVTVTFNNYNADDYSGAVDEFVDIVNQPSRIGTYTSVYPSRN